MKFKLVTASVLSVTLLLGFGQTDEVFAERSIESVNQDISSVESDIINNVEKVNSITKEIESIQTVINKNNKNVDTKEKEINNFNKEVKKLKEEIKQLEKDIKERNEILKERLVAYQKLGGDLTYLEVIFGSTGFEDFISRFTAVKTITKADNDLVEDQENSVKEVEKNEKSIDTKIKDSKEAKAELEKIVKDNKVKETVLAKTKSNVKSEKKNLEKKKVSYVKEGNDIKALEERARINLVNKQEAERQLASTEKQRVAEEKEASTQSKSSVAKAKASPAKSNNSSPAKSNNSSPAKSSESKSTSAPSSSSKTLTMQATAYTAECYGCSGITATGLNLNKNRNMKVVAVDPSVIPLGSRVWVSGYGEAVAGDTGGDIKGSRIDLHFPTKKAAYAFGRKSVTVKILN